SLRSDLGAKCRNASQLWQIRDAAVSDAGYNQAVPVCSKSSMSKSLVREVGPSRRLWAQWLSNAGLHAARKLRQSPEIFPQVGAKGEERCAKLRVGELV